MTKSERFRRLYALGCICCRLHPGIVRQAQIHHIVDKGYRRLSGGDRATIPLCPWHHQGYPANDLSVSDTRDWLGPSLALEKREFNRFYTELLGVEGSAERALLEVVEGMIGDC